MSTIDLERPGPWRDLFAPALELMAHLEQKVPGAVWTFGGGTALMLRIAHRHSKDIDLFVPDPQYLGYVSPRLSDVAEGISTEYVEAAEYIKLFLPKGEIDVVVGKALTDVPYETVSYRGRQIRVETSAEIVAKKMWHRGDRAKGRDLFDLCAVADAEPEQILRAAPFMRRHGAAFLQALIERDAMLRREFAQIDAIGPGLAFERCRAQADALLRPLLSGPAPAAPP
ncbi:nucleotidyl transferase AbiEii/AbiGii toxin family protein [Luteimonas huabeiensis]|uniref:nucleotidyl transferase AbiEii/AbiGii toxin family protein n=1 Tax=Luteimonas huabeiensis TaxID=1244513 RepID=UPI000467A0FA|nr:nucleotidyl transferase AbiEii/AbiGii toxin family protein [Luteimonas huabeiensis]